MNFSLLALWALVGICPDWWPRRWPPPPGPWPWIRLLISIVGGVLGGWIFSQVFGVGPRLEGPNPALYAAATCVGAFVGAVIAGSIVDLATRGRQVAGG